MAVTFALQCLDQLPSLLPPRVESQHFFGESDISPFFLRLCLDLSIAL